jgi:poly(A) polymerase
MRRASSTSVLSRRLGRWARNFPRTKVGAVVRLLTRIRGAEVALVGGAVRDAALGRPAKDIDLLVRGVGISAIERAIAGSGRVDRVGRRFGVLKWTPRGLVLPEPVDIALPRQEHAFGTGGYRDFEVQSDPSLPIESDLQRRDFTVNAMAWSLTERRLLDPFGGLRDAAQGWLRAVGSPGQRFAEDRSRAVRAVRFAAQLGFRIEPATLRAVRAAAAKLNAVRRVGGVSVRVVPLEVIARELVRALLADPVVALDTLDATGILPALLPEVAAMKGVPQPRQFHAEGDVYRHTRLALSFLSSPGFRRHFRGYAPTANMVVALLLHDIGKPKTLKTPKAHGTDRIRFDGHDAVGSRMARTVVERLRLSSAGVDAEVVGRLVARHLIFTETTIDAMRATKVEALFVLDPEFGRELLALKYCDGAATINPRGQHTLRSLYRMERRIAALKPRGRAVARLVNGHDLMRALGIPPGPEVGRLLEALREAQLTGRVRTRSQALALARRLARTNP